MTFFMLFMRNLANYGASWKKFLPQYVSLSFNLPNIRYKSTLKSPQSILTITTKSEKSKLIVLIFQIKLLDEKIKCILRNCAMFGTQIFNFILRLIIPLKIVHIAPCSATNHHVSEKIQINLLLIKYYFKIFLFKNCSDV